MKAVVWYKEAKDCIEVREIERPKPGPGEVLLEIKAAAICGTELHAQDGETNVPTKFPVVLGHEYSGVVAELGPGVKGFSVGDRAVGETTAYACGICPVCRIGQYNLCRKRLIAGYAADGAFAKYMKVPVTYLHHLPPSISFEEGSLIEPLCVAYNALVEKVTVKPGDTVVVLGPGPIGLFCLEVAKVAGASKVIVSGLSDDRRRLEIAKELGADQVINSEAEDVVAKVMEVTNGFGADVVADAAGPSETLRQSIEMVRPAGKIIKIGWGPQPVGFSLDKLLGKGATLQGTLGHNFTVWEAAIRLLDAGLIQASPLISAEYPITEWRKAFDVMRYKSGVTAVLRPVD
ncbi:MAG: zinc-binding dehydrogenase [bacterium]|jgi:alcohol dehydrogenase/L-iditol 2-dehydrogenase